MTSMELSLAALEPRPSLRQRWALRLARARRWLGLRRDYRLAKRQLSRAATFARPEAELLELVDVFVRAGDTPRACVVLAELAERASNAGRSTDAVALLEWSLSLRPDDIGARSALAARYETLGRMRDAAHHHHLVADALKLALPERARQLREHAQRRSAGAAIVAQAEHEDFDEDPEPTVRYTAGQLRGLLVDD